MSSGNPTVKSLTSLYDKNKLKLFEDPQQELQFAIIRDPHYLTEGSFDEQQLKLKKKLLSEANINEEMDKLLGELMFLNEERDKNMQSNLDADLEIKHLKDENERLLKQLQTLEKNKNEENVLLEDKIQNSEDKNKISELENDMNNYKEEIQNLKDKNEDLEKQIEELKNITKDFDPEELDFLRGKNKELEQELKEIKNLLCGNTLPSHEYLFDLNDAASTVLETESSSYRPKNTEDFQGRYKNVNK